MNKNLTIIKLNGVKQSPEWMKIGQFTELKQSIQKEILNLPTIANVRSKDNFVWILSLITFFLIS